MSAKNQCFHVIVKMIIACTFKKYLNKNNYYFILGGIILIFSMILFCSDTIAYQTKIPQLRLSPCSSHCVYHYGLNRCTRGGNNTNNGICEGNEECNSLSCRVDNINSPSKCDCY